MKLIIVESPYAGDIERNVAYAKAALVDCLKRGEAPIASHLLYTQPGVLDDNIPEERKLGIDAGLAWRRVADKAVFYTDFGMSGGMKAALELYQTEFMPVEFRSIEDFEYSYTFTRPTLPLDQAVVDWVNSLKERTNV